MALRPRSRDVIPKRPRLAPVEESARALESPTAVAMEALRTGLLPLAASRRRKDEINHEDAILVGDPDDSSFANEYGGEETPGGSNPTPDQNNVDAIGRAYGLQEEDTGALQAAGDVLARRDRRRSELRAPARRR
jgi:hypothetical protein